MEAIIIVPKGNDCGLKVKNKGEGSDKKMEYALKVKSKLFNILIHRV